MTMADGEVTQPPSEITVLKERGYTLKKKVGEGSYAKVYQAEYLSSTGEPSEKLACKIMDTSRAPKDFVRKFLPRELDIVVKIHHPHLIHVHSIFQRRAKYFIFMRYAENGDMLDFVLKHGSVAESQARVWMRQMALGLQYMHEMELAHRDLKCENMLITSNFNVKIADFGFARKVVDAKGKPVLSDTYCGSLSYAAPEILKGAPYSPKVADVWSLGVVLYIMINKAMPFDDTNVKRLYDQQTNRRWKFRSKVVDKISDELKGLVTHMLEPDVNKRIRIGQVVTSDWIGMDPRLLTMTPEEQQALVTATASSRRRKQQQQATASRIRDEAAQGAAENNPDVHVLHAVGGDGKTDNTDPRFRSSLLFFDKA